MSNEPNLTQEAPPDQREWWIDLIRVVVVMLVIVFHVFCAFARDLFGPGIQFHVWNTEFLDEAWLYIRFVDPWQMHILFLLAGISIVFSLKKRTTIEFQVERIKRLGIPLLFGYLIWNAIEFFVSVRYVFKMVPVIAFNVYQTPFAPSFSEFYSWWWWKAGLVNAGHLWFIAVLLPISLIAAYVVNNTNLKRKVNSQDQNTPSSGKDLMKYFFHPGFLILFALVSVPLDIMGEVFPISVLQWSQILFFAYGVMLGLNLQFLTIFQKHFKWTLPLGISILVGYAFFPQYFIILKNVGAWMLVYGLIGLTSKYVNRASKALKYLSKASMAMYILHLPIEICLGYYILPLTWSPIIKFIGLLTGTFGGTFLLYELIRRLKLKVLWWLIGIPVKTQKKKDELVRPKLPSIIKAIPDGSLPIRESILDED